MYLSTEILVRKEKIYCYGNSRFAFLEKYHVGSMLRFEYGLNNACLPWHTCIFFPHQFGFRWRVEKEVQFQER